MSMRSLLVAAARAATTKTTTNAGMTGVGSYSRAVGGGTPRLAKRMTTAATATTATTIANWGAGGNTGIASPTYEQQRRRQQEENRQRRRSLTTATATKKEKKKMVKNKPNAVFLNASRLDYDRRLDWSRVESLCENLVLHRKDNVQDVDEVLRLVDGMDIVIAKEMQIPKTTFEQFPTHYIGLLCEAGTGYNNWPAETAREKYGIPLCNIPTYSTEAVAHMAVTYLMNFSVSMFDQQRMLQGDDRSNFNGPFTLPLHEINDKTIGLVGGAGRIGTKVGQIALALGMKVIVSSRRGSLPESHALYGNDDVVCTDDVNYLLENSDYVSLHTPLNDETRGTFGREQIERMKPTSFLINTSRGGVCNEAELVECMREEKIAGAGLDVTTTEPPSRDSPLWDLPNVWLSPHTGWRRIETRQRLVDMTADNIEAYCYAHEESELINVVN